MSFRSKFFGVLGASFLSFAPWGGALLQGNQVHFIASPDSPNEFRYNLDESAPDAYTWVSLQSIDLTSMNYLSFWAQLEASSEGGPVYLFIELQEDTNGDGRFTLNPDISSRVSAGKFSGPEAGGEWKKVVIPLSQFHGIRYRERLLEMGLVAEIKKGRAAGKLLIERLLFGTNYPEGIQGQEIRMQNRVSSFKIANRAARSEMLLKRKTMPLVLTLTFIDPYLEVIRFEESKDKGQSWRPLASFYDHQQGGTYQMNWNPSNGSSKQGILIRAVGMSVLGGETELAGPYHIRFN